jgi:hypothetical protein
MMRISRAEAARQSDDGTRLSDDGARFKDEEEAAFWTGLRRICVMLLLLLHLLHLLTGLVVVGEVVDDLAWSLGKRRTPPAKISCGVGGGDS